MDKLIKYKNIFRWIFFGLLVIVSTTPLIALIMQGISSESLITDKIYGLNGFLCIISALAVVAYWIGVYFLKPENSYGTYKHKKTKKKIDIKAYLKKAWPCILLVIFMGWTAIGCIQASMEAAAEAALRDDIEENDTERNKEIAAWTEGDRMPNAADRAWNGCNNLKDGYFSFLFYAMVVVDVIMLGANSDNLKKWILRIFLITSIILVLFSFLSLIDIKFLNGMVKYNRAIFNNSNHYGYYLCISTVLAAMMFIKEKNIYFKVMALLGFILMTFVLIINNTFGAYLGVATAIIMIALATIIKLIMDVILKNKVKVMEFLKVVGIAIIFAVFSSTIAGAEILTTKVTERTNFIYSTVYLKVGENNYSIYYNKRSGFDIEKDKSERKATVQANFEQLAKDAGIILNFFQKDEKTENEVEDIELTSEETTNTESTENKSGLTNEVSKTGSGRGEVWIKSLDLIKQRPLFGWGLENMLNEFYQQFGINEGRTHNLILQLAGTTGIVGMLLYMIAVIAIFFKVLLNYKNWGLVEYVIVPVFIAYMVSSMFGNSAFYTSPYFMIILGMMIASMIYKENNKNLEKETLKQMKQD